MNTAFIQHEIKFTLYTVSTSLLLCTSMEVQASSVEDEAMPWYRRLVLYFARKQKVRIAMTWLSRLHRRLMRDRLGLPARGGPAPAKRTAER